MDRGGDQLAGLTLDFIRSQLIRLEDTILFSLIERAQFPRLPTIYAPGAIIDKEVWTGSFMEWLLHEQECVHSKVRRYEAPDEHPFTSPLPPTILRPKHYPSLLHPCGKQINVNAAILAFYVTKAVPQLCREGDRGEMEEHYGSAATRDVECLQALSRRIHFGKYVAEVKFVGDEPTFRRLIAARDVHGLEAAITDAAVEQKVLLRLASKGRAYTGGDAKVDVDAVVEMYRELVIPLTKLVEVEYLLSRA